jgi:Ras GTPase-activating-like protein IQGAP2/3
MEVKSGKKSKMKRDVTEEEAAADPNVKSILTQRAKELQEVVQLFLDKILGSMNSLPYGLRLISAQIRRLILDKFPKTKPDEIWPIIGYFTYYRFINLAVVQPDTFDIGGRDLSLTVRKNLVVVGKVLQTLFRLDTFKDKEELAPMNSWLQAQRRAVTEYFSDLIDVPPPEDYLQVNQYMELTQRSKPLIIIAMREIVETHRLIKDCVGQITKGAEDPLAIVAKELGEVPNLGRDLGDREVQLNLENRFKDTMEDEIKPGAHTYAETKELIIQVLKQIPIKAGAPQTLASIINDAGKFAKDSNNKALAKTVNKILKNFAKLEETNMITPKDNYTSLLKDVALEVTNRAERREQQQKEIARLQATLKNLKKHQEFMNDQISEFEKYLDSCRKNSAARIKLKNKPVKFPYKDLVKKGVIIDSEVPDLTKFFISMPEAGVFDIEAKIAGMSVGKMQLELEDLLEKKENNQLRLELDQVTLNVPSTIFLINKYFLS